MPLDTNNIIVISDTHCGCRLGLCSQDGLTLDEGGVYKPSKIQKKMWNMWRTFWDEWVPDATRGEDYVVVMNGDALDGTPHNSKSNISPNVADQANIAYELLAPIVELCGGNYYHIRGTEAHVGKSGEQEEQLATRLGAIPNSEGQSSRFELRKSIGPKRKIVHILHHIGTTGSQSYEATAVGKELIEAFVESARWGNKPPSVSVRSHRHRSIGIQFPVQDAIETTETGLAFSVVTPAWQAKTPFCYKIPGARLSTPQFGGVLIRWSHDELFVRIKVWTIPPSKVE